MKRLFSFVLTAAVLVASANAMAKPKPAHLIGLEVKADTVTLAVISQGCTTKGYFKFAVRRGGGGTRLTVLRDQNRFCLVTRHVIKLTYTRKEIGLKPGERFVVTNTMGRMPKMRRQVN